MQKNAMQISVSYQQQCINQAAKTDPALLFFNNECKNITITINKENKQSTVRKDTVKNKINKH